MDDIFYPLHSFKEQFTLVPEIINQDKLVQKKNIIVAGMGGSAISVSLLTILFPELPITLHNGYGLPKITDKENTLLILNSYSGNTEEILDCLHDGREAGIYHISYYQQSALNHVLPLDIKRFHFLLSLVNMKK